VNFGRRLVLERRIAIPMMGPVPLAFDFAFPITSEPGDREQVFSFYVGINR
jgi:outer membrane protein insertion porin family